MESGGPAGGADSPAVLILSTCSGDLRRDAATPTTLKENRRCPQVPQHHQLLLNKISPAARVGPPCLFIDSFI